jgi:oligoendopeptidase F
VAAQHPDGAAETASIFCETIVANAALRTAGRPSGCHPRASAQGSCQIVVDITSRFLFESAVFEQRAERELAVDELNALMLQAQREPTATG